MKSILNFLYISILLVSCQQKENNEVKEEKNSVTSTQHTETQEITSSTFNGKLYTFPSSQISYTAQVPTSKTLIITPSGLKNTNESITLDITGYEIRNIEIGDLDRDSYPELFIYLQALDGSNFTKFIGYSPTKDQILHEILSINIEEDILSNASFQGNNDMAIVENTFVQRFPIYAQGELTDKTKQLQYKLTQKGNRKELVLDKAFEY